VLESSDADALVKVLQEAIRESQGRLERAQGVMAEVADLLSKKPEILASFLTRFRSEQNSDLLYTMMQILMDVRNPDLVSTMLAQARDPQADPLHRRAALGVIDGHNDWAQLSSMTELVSTERDPEILGAAIHALPEGGAFSPAEAQRTSLVLTQVLSMETPEYEPAREAAALSLGQWAATATERERMLRTLRHDPSVKVRMAAAFGLIFAAEKDPVLLQALAEVVRDSSEDATVRTNAWRALGSMRILPDEYVAVYREFEKQKSP